MTRLFLLLLSLPVFFLFKIVGTASASSTNHIRHFSLFIFTLKFVVGREISRPYCIFLTKFCKKLTQSSAGLESAFGKNNGGCYCVDVSYLTKIVFYDAQLHFHARILPLLVDTPDFRTDFHCIRNLDTMLSGRIAHGTRLRFCNMLHTRQTVLHRFCLPGLPVEFRLRLESRPGPTRNRVRCVAAVPSITATHGGFHVHSRFLVAFRCH